MFENIKRPLKREPITAAKREIINTFPIKFDEVFNTTYQRTCSRKGKEPSLGDFETQSKTMGKYWDLAILECEALTRGIVERQERKASREYGSTIGLDRELREYIIQYFDLIDFDIKQAYPTFLTMLTKTKINGDIYNYFAEKQGITRDEAKREVNKTINASCFNSDGNRYGVDYCTKIKKRLFQLFQYLQIEHNQAEELTELFTESKGFAFALLSAVEDTIIKHISTILEIADKPILRQMDGFLINRTDCNFGKILINVNSTQIQIVSKQSANLPTLQLNDLETEFTTPDGKRFKYLSDFLKTATEPPQPPTLAETPKIAIFPPKHPIEPLEIKPPKNAQKPPILANKKKIIETPIKTACNSENWNTEISAFEKWLLTATLPAAPFHLNRCTVINDIPLFIDVSIETIKNLNGSPAYRPYFDRLLEFKKLVSYEYENRN
jgi:hypothetical protein